MEDKSDYDDLLVKFEEWDKKIGPLFNNYVKLLKKLIIQFAQSIIIYTIFAGIYLGIYNSIGFEKTLIIILVGVIIFNNQLVAYAISKT